MTHTREWLTGAIAALKRVQPLGTWAATMVVAEIMDGYRAELAALPVEPDLLEVAEKALESGIHHEAMTALTALRARRKA